MYKQIKISEYMFKQLWLEKKQRELKLGTTLSYSEVIGLLMGLTIQNIRDVHKIKRYEKFHDKKYDHKC